MAMPVQREREQQEEELEGEGECGEEIERDIVEVAPEGQLGLEDLEEENEDEDEDEDLEEEDDEEEEDDGEEVFSSGRGESEEGDDKEEEVSSGVRVLFKKNPPSVIVQYAEDGEQVEFERHDSSDQTDSDSEEEVEEEDNDEVEDEVKAGQEHTSSAFLEQSLAVLLENVTARTGGGALGGGAKSPSKENDEGLYVVNDHDYYMSLAYEFPKLEDYRVNANRSTMIKRMAQSALVMKLPPCGLYLAVLLLDFYWNHDRSMGRRMDSVQLHVLAYTCLFIASNRFGTPRTPDEFCQWAGVAEGSVKGCMIVRQLEAFEKLLKGAEKLSSVTCQSLWQQLKQFPDRDSKYPELKYHMSKFLMDLEQTDYGITYFNPPAAVKAAHDVWRTHATKLINEMSKLNGHTNYEDPGMPMRRMLLLASMSAGNKRAAHDLVMDKAGPNMNKRGKFISLPHKIAAL